MTLAQPPPTEPVPLRISYLLPQFPVPTEVFAVSDIAALRQQGHQVIVHTIKPRRGDEDARLRLAGVASDLAIRRPTPAGALRWPVVLWKHRRPARALLRRIAGQVVSAPSTAIGALLSLPRVCEIVDEILASDADVVHVFWSRHAGMALPVLAGSGARAVRSAFVGAYDLIADDFLVDIALRWSQTTFTHAEANRAFLASRAPAGVPVHVIHRGIPLMARDDRIVRDPDLWLTASALAPAKNVEGVLRAFAEARGGRPQLRLEICGDGPDRARLEHLCGALDCTGAVAFRGHIGREDLFRQMQRASVFVLLSKKPAERLPNVIKEALWAGCAVLASPSEGIGELLPGSRFGRVVDPDDPVAVAEAGIAAMAEAPEQARERVVQARKFISERFSSSSSMRRYIAAWRDAAAVRAIAGPIRGAGVGQRQRSSATVAEPCRENAVFHG